MVQKDLQLYIKDQLHQGTGKDIIINSLLAKGWQKADVDDSYNSVTIDAQTPSSATNMHESPDDITEKKYPIQFLWVFQSIIVYSFAMAYFIFIYGRGKNSWAGYVFYAIYLLLHIAYIMLRRKLFHFAIGKTYLNLQQGVINKQQRHIPLGVIQNVYVKQGIMDRMFGLASLTIENAVQNSNTKKGVFSMLSGNNATQSIGSSANGGIVAIPGLKKADAEQVKTILLQRVKENSAEANQSGL